MAAQRIKGITIEIDGNTQKLNKALKSSYDVLTKTQAELKDIDKLLKLDPKNTELLKQKQDALKTSIDATKDILDQEKLALEQAMQAGDSEEARQAQNLLKREIIETENKLNALEKEYKEINKTASKSLKEIASKTKEVGEKVTQTGETLTKNITAPIVAVGTASVAAFKEVDDSLDVVAIKTGATGDKLEEMESIAKNIAKTIPTDFATAGEAVGEVSTRFGLTGEKLENLSSTFVKFAKINNTDVTSSVDTVQKAMAAFNIPVEQADLFLDSLNVTAQNTGADVLQLASNLTTNAAALKSMGFNAAGATQFLGKLETSGIDASQVLTGLKKALVNSAKEGLSTSEALEKYDKSIKNANSSTEAINAATELFGAKAGPAIAEAIRNEQLSFESLNSTLDENAGRIETTFENITDPVDQLTTSLNSVKDAGASLGAVVIQQLLPIINKITQTINDAKNKFDSLTEGQKKAIVIVAGIIAAIGPLLLIIGKVIIMISTVSTALSVLAANPIILIIAGVTIAIIALIAGIVLLIKNWDKVKAKLTEFGKKLEEIGNKIKEFGAKIKNSITDKFAELKNKAKTWAIDMIDNFVKGIKDRLHKVKEGAESIAKTIKSIIGFSEPEKGPLSNFHTFAPDMIDLWNKGIKENLPEVQAQMQLMAGTVNNELASSLARPENQKTDLQPLTNLLNKYLPMIGTKQPITIDGNALIGYVDNRLGGIYG